MKYVRVIQKCDPTEAHYLCAVQTGVEGFTIVANELFTLKEWEKLKRRYGEHIDKLVEEIEIPKSKTHRFFGVRVEDKEDDNKTI